VFAIDGLSDLEVWELGDLTVVGSRTISMLARAELTVAEASIPPLVVRRCPPPPRHVAIQNWPEKSHAKVLAMQLARDARLRLR
jgi:hypothetical protein